MAGVLGLEAIDDVEQEDYQDVVVPAINAAIAEHGKVRLVYLLGPQFDEYEGASFERIAIVTDARWVPLAEVEAAKRWAAAEAS